MSNVVDLQTYRKNRTGNKPLPPAPAQVVPFRRVVVAISSAAAQRKAA